MKKRFTRNQMMQQVRKLVNRLNSLPTLNRKHSGNDLAVNRIFLLNIELNISGPECINYQARKGGTP